MYGQLNDDGYFYNVIDYTLHYYLYCLYKSFTELLSYSNLYDSFLPEFLFKKLQLLMSS